jgi:mono/diheme cytochrome c family protein
MRTMNISKLILGIVALLVAPIVASAQQGESHIGKVSGHADAGRQLYFRYCWGCHGFRGDGNGENPSGLIYPSN